MSNETDRIMGIVEDMTKEEAVRAAAEIMKDADISRSTLAIFLRSLDEEDRMEVEAQVPGINREDGIEP